MPFAVVSSWKLLGCWGYSLKLPNSLRTIVTSVNKSSDAPSHTGASQHTKNRLIHGSWRDPRMVLGAAMDSMLGRGSTCTISVLPSQPCPRGGYNQMQFESGHNLHPVPPLHTTATFCPSLCPLQHALKVLICHQLLHKCSPAPVVHSRSKCST